ncbi:WD40-repeat-containing domain protein [Jimgerdemannia flammicorona]|uniref:Cleavage stimulation factor 50 kDa subunit n=1 Tax=Jimgerdemannia flammicorona TaxID=994334 RepID=A0A433PVF3_9FUNG|nr:WD40-repeat-containing domain protein [Jimgerdemannia flammicorona]
MEPNVLSQDEVLLLIVSQLAAYGFSQLAQTVAAVTGAVAELAPSSKLSELLFLGKEQDESEELEPTEFSAEEDQDEPMEGSGDSHSKYLDFDNELKPTSRPFPEYTQLYYTQHKGPCRCAAFSTDGKYAATGSHDTSLKVLDVSKMKNRTGDAGDKPVIRTLYDHVATVNDLSFHPNGLVLASCSDDQSIKLFDLSKPGVKRAFRTHTLCVPSAFIPLATSSWQVCIDTLRTSISSSSSPTCRELKKLTIQGTDDNSVRIYDVKTFQCYTTPSTAPDLHRGGITHVRYSSTGSVFATSSADGSVKVWDGVSGKCVRSIENAHAGAPVSSVRLSRNGKYVLSAGKDSVIRLWDVGSGREMVRYEGAGHMRESLQAAFTYNEDFVLMGDENSYNVLCWDTRTGILVKKIQGQNNIVKCVATSTTDPGFLSCSVA